MKNTLIFLSAEGLGLNKAWKGNCLKLADKPNINHLISGIYPWATLSNELKTSKINIKKQFNCVSNDIDKNYYQMLHGNTNALTLNDKIQNEVDNKELIHNPLFVSLSQHAIDNGSKYVHVFFLLSQNKFHCSLDNFKYILNMLIKKGLVPVLHLIADGKESHQYSFASELRKIEPFLSKRNIHIGSISGRNHALIQQGRDYLNSSNVYNYYRLLCGMGDNNFSVARDYATKNMFDKVLDQDILPAFNNNFEKYYIDKNDSILFIDSDYDNYAPLLNLFRQEKRFQKLFVASTNLIYGNEVDITMYPQDDTNNSIASVASANNLKTLIISASHKKGFISKYYGFEKDANITKKIVKTDYTKNTLDYLFSINKSIFDAAIKGIGKYDLIIIHNPSVAEAAHEGNLRLLKFAIENFDKNLGRLVNYTKVTGSVMAFVSPYGASEKMLNKKLEIVPQIKNSIVPFVFTNGDLSSRSLKSNFLGVYATLLVSLGLSNLDQGIYNRSLISRNYNMNIVHDKLLDHYQVWKDELAVPIIEQFASTQLSLYADMSKDPNYIAQKQQYIVIKELIKLHEKIFTTPEARKAMFDKLLRYVRYNGIDFEGFKYNYSKLLMTLFDSEIKLSKLSSFTYRYFDNRLWRTNIKKNDKWFTKIKSEIIPSFNREIPEPKIKKLVDYIDATVEPYQYFERLFESEKQVLLTNDAEKIVEFYTNIKEEVATVYNGYFGVRAPKTDEQVVFEEQEDILNNPDFNKVVSYYEAFNEVIELVESNKERAYLFNLKYQENQNLLKNKVEVTDVFSAQHYLLNYLVKKIVAVYQAWMRKNKTFRNELNKPVNQKISKYDNKYAKKYNLALSAISYEGEFFEGLDLSNQESFESQMNQKVKDVGVFDYPTLDVFEEEKDDIVFKLSEEVEPELIRAVDQNINMKADYDLTQIWNKKRNDEYRNVDNILYSITNEAENDVMKERKFRDSRDKVKQYDNLSNIWHKKVSTHKNSRDL